MADRQPGLQEAYDRLAAEQEAAVLVIEGLLWAIEELEEARARSVAVSSQSFLLIEFKREDARRVLASARGQKREQFVSERENFDSRR